MELITVEEYNKVTKQIEEGDVSVNSRYVLGEFGEVSILHIAVYMKDYKFISHLLNKRVDVTINEASCGTVLHLAVFEKLKNLVIFRILDSGADVNAQDSAGNTALHLAVKGNQVKIAKMLLEHGADVNVTCFPTREIDCWTPLDLAIIGNNLELIELLLTNELDIDCRSKVRYPPLVIASLYGSDTAMEMILRRGADVNYCKEEDLIAEFPLQAAVISGDLSKLKILLRSVNIQVDKKNLGGETSLHYAMSSPKKSCLQYLLDAGADVNLLNNRGQLPLESNDRKSAASKRLLLKHHLVKLDTAGCRLAEGNLKAIQGKEFEDLRLKCAKEVEELKQTFVGSSNFSLFSVLHKNAHWLARRLKRIDEGDILNSNIRERFPLYGNMLHHKLKMGANRKQLLINVEKLINDIFLHKLPDTFVRNISSYLTNQDLEVINEDKSSYSLWV